MTNLNYQYNLWIEIIIAILAMLTIGLAIMYISSKRCLRKLKEEVVDNFSNVNLIINTIPDPVFVVDLKGYILRVNQAAEKLNCKEEDRYEGKKISQFITIYDNYNGQQYSNPVEEILRDTKLVNKRILIRIGAEKHFIVEMNAELLVSELKQSCCLVLVMKDLRVERRVNEYFMQAQKLEKLELSARSCAHDVNNMLGGVICMGEVVQMKLGEGNEVEEYVNRIIENCDRAAMYIKKVQAIAKNSPGYVEKIDINDKILKLVKSYDVFSAFKLKLNAEKNLINVNESRVGLALTNICMNALQSVDHDEGELNIITSNVELGVQFCYDNDLVQSSLGFVRIVVSYSGCGMSQELQDMILKPSSESNDHGLYISSIGLDGVYDIIHDNNGCLSIESKLNEGCAFTIHLPVSPIEG